MLDSSGTSANANPDQIVEISIRQAFDVKKNRRPIQLWIKDICGVDLVLADSERSQRVMKFLSLALGMSAAPPWTKSVLQLRNREDALAV